MSSGRNAIALSVLICFVGYCVHIATLRRAGGFLESPSLIAIGLTLAGYLPPLWISTWNHLGAARQIAVVLWRFGLLLPALLLAKQWEGVERNCFLYTMLACYFVALPLESWLLVRDVKRSNRLNDAN